MKGYSQVLHELLEPAVTGLGYELIGIELLRHGGGTLVRVYIDACAGVRLADCERVSHQVSGILDVADPIRGPYTLEVSSPGLDRPLRHADEYRRFEGRLAKVVLREPIDGQTHFRGRLRGLEEDPVARVVIETDDGRVHRLPIGVITRGNLEVEF